MNDNDWLNLARCKDADPDDFHPTETRHETRVARDWCHGCVAIEACLNDVLDYETRRGHSNGVAGGMTGAQRQAIVNKRKKATA